MTKGLALSWGIGIAAVAGPVASRAQDSAITHAISVYTDGGTTDVGAGASWRLRLPGGTQLGLGVRAARAQESYVDGWRVDDATSVYGQAEAYTVLLRSGPLTLGLDGHAGVRRLFADDATPGGDASTALVSAVGPVAHVRIGPGSLALGWQSVQNFQLDPGFAVDALGQVGRVGYAFGLTEDWQMYADLTGGGLFGYDGDGGKFLTRGTLGVRFVPSAAHTWTAF
jgi:hypothetical protein